MAQQATAWAQQAMVKAKGRRLARSLLPMAVVMSLPMPVVTHVLR
jgi:hypothetical protein